MRYIKVPVPERCSPECPLTKSQHGYYKCYYRKENVYTWYLKPVKACREAEIKEEG